MDEDTFWSWSPAETFRWLRAREWRMKREIQRDIALAHTIESFARVKHLKPLKSYMPRPPAKRLTPDEIEVREKQNREWLLNQLKPEERKRQQEIWDQEDRHT